MFFNVLPTDQIADAADEVICYSPSSKDGNSEVQSLNSFQSDSCDDNGRVSLIFKDAKFRFSYIYLLVQEKKKQKNT